jgi:hypothetical protein
MNISRIFRVVLSTYFAPGLFSEYPRSLVYDPGGRGDVSAFDQGRACGQRTRPSTPSMPGIVADTLQSVERGPLLTVIVVTTRAETDSRTLQLGHIWAHHPLRARMKAWMPFSELITPGIDQVVWEPSGRADMEA